ncbi:high mobility group protein DSP1-like [Anopheles cruzii]|uniref:high mobility group protein DSP1-like n=1 Tax=Anopheles cruzii TaxID=68878 RepID=UPI0022EC4336|nr:high mobility group protein DSP1-like [Anopheles cruzii]
MSEHHRAAWGSREDAVWWPNGITSTEQQTLQHHQHLINQHHQQQHAQLQHQAAVQQHQAAVQQQQQQQNDSARINSTTSTSITQKLLSYRMINNIQNPISTDVTVSTSTAPYDYGLGVSTVVARPGDPPTMASTAPTTQWVYPGGQNALDNSLQQQQPELQNQGKVKDDKPKRRLTAYTFFVQTCRDEHRKKHPEEQVIFAEFSRKCAARWKTMLDKEKRCFHEMAEKDKQRFELEMQNYVPPNGAVVGRGKKRKQRKDPNAPKRSLSSYFWFCHDERNKVKALNPTYRVGDIAKELGRRWSDLNAEIKQKYEQMAAKDKQRYQQEMTEYKSRCKNEQGGGTPGLNLPQQLQQAGLQPHLPPSFLLPPLVPQVAAAQLQAHVVQVHHATAAAAAAAVQQQNDDNDDDDDDDEDSEEDDNE